MQDLSHICDYTTVHDNAGSLTHWARPGIELATLWFLVGFISTPPQWELGFLLLLCSFILWQHLHHRLHPDTKIRQRYHKKLVQGRGWIRVAAASLLHSQGNTRSEPHLWPTLQLVVMPNPWPIEWGQGLIPHPHWYYVGFLACWATMGTPPFITFTSLISVARTCKTILNKICKSGHPYVVPDISRNSFSFSLLRMLATGCHI